MHLRDAFRNALHSIASHKLRSFLTLTGIVIGVLAVVTMFSSVYALKTLIKTNMEGMGWNNTILIMPVSGQQQTSLRRLLRFRKSQEDIKALNYADYQAVRNTIPHKSVIGTVERQMPYSIRNKTVQISLRGVSPEFFTDKNYYIMRGRMFNLWEEENASPVMVLGYYFAEEQFSRTNPVGKWLTFGGKRFLVIGVLDKDVLNKNKGMDFNRWQRESDLKGVYVPLKYASRYLTVDNSISYITIKAREDSDFTEIKRQVRQLLLARHSMFPNFQFMDIGEMMLNITKEINENMRKWNITLFAIASISLLVGGIGLFSTLLISIQEKMLEIGIRKSIGATEKDIFFYFIFEAITLAIVGALMGILLASLALLGMQAAFKIPMPLPVQGVALGILFSVLIGFISGLYPALKASSLDPIKAIYYYE